MKEKILNSTLSRIFDITCSKDLVAPTTDKLSSLEYDELVSLYSKAWDLINEINALSFECGQAVSLLNKVNL